MKKHHGAVCAIARDEGRYALEWAAYHLALGFDHVFLYDNLSIQPLSALFDPRAAHPFVTVTLWPTIPGRNPQLEAYGHFLAGHVHAVDWVAFLDLDEMLHLKRHASVRAFLADRTEADGVAVNWRVFGSAGESRYRPGLAMARFTRASALDFGPHCHVKTIARADRVASPAYHHMVYAGDARVVAADGLPVPNESLIAVREASFAVAQVNHYFVRSREEWGEKVRRGYADGTVRALDMFEAYDRNEVEDRSILVRRRDTERWMKRIGAKRPKAWW